MKDKYHVTSSSDAEKASEKNSIFNIEKIGYKMNVL
jgi:hypothetical protein